MAPIARDDSHWIADLPWPTVAARLAAGATALLPIGAASKEHGPHLPLGTDCIQASYFSECVAASCNALLWPVVAYGYYPAFRDYPGSISLQEPTFSCLVTDILEDIARAGAHTAVLLNTGISTIGPLEALLALRPQRMPVRLINCYAGTRFCAVVAEVAEQAFGGHADEIETALMLAIKPSQVHLELAVASVTPIEHGAFNRRDPDAKNYSPSGVNGDPSLASVAKGQRLLEALVADVIDEVSRDIRA